MSDATLKEGAVPVLFVEPFGPSFAEAFAKLAQEPKVQVIRCADPMAAVAKMAELPCALVVLHAKVPADIVKHSAMLKMIQPQVKKGRARFIVNTNLNQVKVLSLLSYYGSSEVITDPINSRAMVFKLQRHIRNLAKDNALALNGGAEIKDLKAKGEARKNKNDKRDSQNRQKIRYVESIKILSDCWPVSRAVIRQLGDGG